MSDSIDPWAWDRTPGKPGVFEYAYVDGGGIEILRADPVIQIPAEAVDELRSGTCRSWASFKDDVLKIHGVNRTVIYQIGEKCQHALAYYAEWPD